LIIGAEDSEGSNNLDVRHSVDSSDIVSLDFLFSHEAGGVADRQSPRGLD
jgi:hypothetical protein